MTKLVGLRVTVAVDDAVDLKDVKPRLQELIVAKGTERIGENGDGGRIHWGTAEVLQGPERLAARKPRTRGQAAEQPELPG